MFRSMDAFANDLIDALGGTTATANLAHTGVSTVHNWRRNGLSASRLDHLHRIAQSLSPSVDVAALAEKHGVVLPCIQPEPAPSSGKIDEISAPVLA